MDQTGLFISILCTFVLGLEIYTCTCLRSERDLDYKSRKTAKSELCIGQTTLRLAPCDSVEKYVKLLLPKTLTYDDIQVGTFSEQNLLLSITNVSFS